MQEIRASHRTYRTPNEGFRFVMTGYPQSSSTEWDFPLETIHEMGVPNMLGGSCHGVSSKKSIQQATSYNLLVTPRCLAEVYPTTCHQHQALLNGQDVATGDCSCRMVLSENRLPQLQCFMAFPTQVAILGYSVTMCHLYINPNIALFIKYIPSILIIESPIAFPILSLPYRIPIYPHSCSIY